MVFYGFEQHCSVRGQPDNGDYRDGYSVIDSCNGLKAGSPSTQESYQASKATMNLTSSIGFSSLSKQSVVGNSENRW